MSDNTTNNISINDLKNAKSNQSEPKEVNISSIVPPRKEAPKKDPLDAYHADGNPMDALQGQLARIKMEEELNQKYLRDKKAMMDLEAEIDGEDTDDNNTNTEETHKTVETVSNDEDDDIFINTKEEVIEKTSLDLDDEDFKELEEDEEEDDSRDKSLKDMQLQIRSKIKPIAKAFDISSFTISKKAVSMSSALSAPEKKSTIAEWVLYHSGKSACYSEFAGYEIEKLNIRTYNTSRRQALKQIYKLIYDHITSEDKPDVFETWLRTTNYYDLDHIWFGIYMSCFSGSNFVPYSCTDSKCDKVTISDDIPFEKMVKYKNDKVKQRVKDILDGSKISKEDATFNVEIVPLSDKYAVALREPSLYNMLFENSILDEKFTNKYQDMLALMVFIDSLYVIDQNAQTLVPIEAKTYPNNEVKTLKSKIVTYSKILKTLTSDQFGQLQAYINKLDDSASSDLTYVLPEATCAKCKKVIPETAMSPQEMLFTRHQLAVLATTSQE